MNSNPNTPKPECLITQLLFKTQVLQILRNIAIPCVLTNTITPQMSNPLPILQPTRNDPLTDLGQFPKALRQHQPCMRLAHPQSPKLV